MPTFLASPGLSKLVYLTADTHTTLTTLDPEAVYIVGGIVDRNRNKGLTAKIAAQYGIKTARLPLDDYVDTKSSKVLTTNHVVEILARYAETGDWAASIVPVVPMRKGYAPKGQAQGAASSSGSSGANEDAGDEEEEEADVEGQAEGEAEGAAAAGAGGGAAAGAEQ